MHVRSLHLYPVKATAPVDVSTAGVEPHGLRNDRRWAVVDVDGHKLDATTDRVLLQVHATAADDGLRIVHPVREPLHVRTPHDGRVVEVDISRLAYARDAGDAAAAWLGALLGKPVRLVWQADPGDRTVSPRHGGHTGDLLSLADVGPVLLTVTESLDQLNAWIASGPDPAAMSMQRFRPNIVVEGTKRPFDEDRWRRIRIGEVAYRFAEQCDRCSITMIDPVTLASGKEPIRTLARHRRRDKKTWFGIRLVPLSSGSVEVGDRVKVEDGVVEDASGLPVAVGEGRLRP